MSTQQQFDNAVSYLAYIAKLIFDTPPVPPHMSLMINEDGDSVDLLLDSTSLYYSEWIRGEGGDICLYRDRDTGKIVGCHLPLYQKRLIVDRIRKV